ncbi:MAG TPA: TraB/GumN family protein [Polyangiaceae bacterium]|nr:TraB/GumN family protein [Polyangiaceae bacterium]
MFLWKAQLGPSTVYFLGSVHVARSELYPLDARIESAFAASDVLVLELDLDPANQAHAAQRMLELGQLPPGVRLRDVVAPATWQLLLDSEQRGDVQLFGMKAFHPWFVALALTTQSLQKQGFLAEQGIDEHFRRAAEGRLRVEALETIDQQLSLFTSLTPEAEETLLRQTLEEMQNYGEQLDASFELWHTGDAAALDRLLLEPMRTAYPALFAQLFSERNRGMLAKLSELTKQPGRYFVVVGAGHLVGAGGIVDLLRAQGIVAQQL